MVSGQIVAILARSIQATGAAGAAASVAGVAGAAGVVIAFASCYGDLCVDDEGSIVYPHSMVSGQIAAIRARSIQASGRFVSVHSQTVPLTLSQVGWPFA